MVTNPPETNGAEQVVRALPWWKKLAFAVLPALVLLALGEVAFRIHYAREGWPRPYRSHPTVGWCQRAQWSGMVQERHTHFNNLGMRDPQPVEPKRADEKRVLVLGDSVAYGYNVDFEVTFGEQVEAMLNHAGTPYHYRVLNGAVCGYDTRQEADWLDTWGWQADPDLVVVAYCANDVSRQHPGSAAMLLHFYNLQHRPVVEWLMEHSALYYYVVKHYHRMRERRIEATPGAVEDFAVSEQWQSTGMPMVREALADIAAGCRRRGVQVMVVVFPGHKELAPGRTPRPYHGELAQLCADLDVAHLDLYDLFAARGGARLFLPHDSCHPNTVGHRLTAVTLFQYLRTHGWSARCLGLPTPERVAATRPASSRPGP